MDIKYGDIKPLGIMAELAEFTINSSWNDIPASARRLAHMHFVDTVATIMGGVQEDSAKATAGFARFVDAKPVATAVGFNMKTSPDLAAFINGIACHSLDWDDLTTTAVHPSAVVAPVAMALGEAFNLSGQKVLEAYAIGCEVLLRMTRGIAPAMYIRGFHPTGTIGSLGAAAAAARLVGLNVEQTKMAFSAAMHQSGGLGQGRGTHQKPLSAASVARAGITAAILVREGLTANPDVLESWNGIRDTYLAKQEGEYDLPTIVAGLGKEWLLEGAWPIKLYPAGGARQTTLAVAIRLAKTHDIDPDKIESIEGMVSPVILKIDYPRPFSALNTRFSNTWSIAVALLTRRGGLEAFTEESFKDQRIWNLLEKIKLVAYPDLTLTPVHGFPTKLTVRMRDGSVYSDEQLEMPGETSIPLTWDHLTEKYFNAAGRIMGEQSRARVWDWLVATESKPRFAELMDLLRPLPEIDG